jgi:transposase
VFVLSTGIPWEDLPQEMGCGSGMTCWRRLRDWQEAGVWQQLHQWLLDELRQADKPDLRMTVEGMLYRMRVGCLWRDLPRAFGIWNSIFKRFNA